MGHDVLSFKCTACGSDKFKGISDNPKPDDVITCAGCGASNTYGVLNKSRMEQGQKVAQDLLRNAFKGIKGFKLTK